MSITEKDLRRITLEPDMPEIRGVETADSVSQPAVVKAETAEDDQKTSETMDETAALEAEDASSPSAVAAARRTEPNKEPKAQPLQEEENREN